MTVREGAPITLLSADGEALMVRAGETIRRGREVLPTAAAIGLEHGDVVRVLGRDLTVVPPLWTDAYRDMKRGPQVIQPGTVAMIVHLAGIGSGSHVLEAGTGSGFLTVALAAIVGPGGSVKSHDINPAALDVARENLARTGLSERVELVEGPLESTSADGVDAVVLDLPEPWSALEAVEGALRPGGVIVAYLPTTTQMERLMRAFGNAFTPPSGHEAIHRAWVLSKGEEGLRPSFEGIGHGGFLVRSRRI